MEHLITDLEAGTYQIKLNGIVSGQQFTVKSDDNTGYFNSSVESSALTVEVTQVN